MCRVELKVYPLQDDFLLYPLVPNVPFGVERPDIESCRSFIQGVPNAPCGVESQAGGTLWQGETSS